MCLGIDARVVTAAVERHYQGLLGEAGASGYEYLDKIVQIPFRIPEPGEDEIRAFIAKQLGDPKRPGPTEISVEDTASLTPNAVADAVEVPNAYSARSAARTTEAVDAPRVSQPMGSARYDAFICASQATHNGLATALKRGLETFGPKPWFRRRTLKLFYPSASLSATPNLWSSTQDALGTSRFFVLIASPESAASLWNSRELSWWLEHRSQHELLIVHAGGELAWDVEARDFDWYRTNALPAVLRAVFVDEPRWLDLRWAQAEEDLSPRDPRWLDALADLAAPIWGVPKDELLAGKGGLPRRADVPIEGTLSPSDAPPSEVAFTYAEACAFQDIARYLRPNPRRLKRLVNVYWFVRALADKKNEVGLLQNPTAIIRWLVVCDQWPYTTQAMLGRFTDLLQEWEGVIPDDAPSGDPLLRLLDDVENRLDHSMRNRLDGEADLLRGLLGRQAGRLDWDELRRIRRYTVNFNPAVEEQIRIAIDARA